MPDDSMVPVEAEPRTEVDILRERVHFLETSGIVELAVINPSVMDHMRHWEGRAEKAEARITTLERELAEAQAHRDTAQSMVQAWVDVFGTIEAHIMDRVYMSDPANPALYLRIIRSDIANIQRSSAQICAARWADNRRQSDAITGLQAEVERLRGLVETAFRDGLSYGTNVVVKDPDEAWRTSRVRAAITRQGETG